MTAEQIISVRLTNQLISTSEYKTAAAVVSRMCAMQAQDFGMAKWAVSLRTSSALKDSEVQKEFDRGSILRTHLLRPTWHFVAPADIRWLLKLSGPRIHAFNASMNRKLELDTKIFKLSLKIFGRSLRGGNQWTRNQLREALNRSKILTDENRMSHILMFGELEGLICSGARQGKQFTYALLDERIPTGKELSRDESLAELSNRYFTARGPATIRDFAWWSGLTITDARKAIELVRRNLTLERWNGAEYFFSSDSDFKRTRKNSKATFLMPDYDEYAISYQDRTVINPLKIQGEMRGGNTLFNHMIVVDGFIAGTWKKIVKAGKVKIETTVFTPLGKSKASAIENAIRRYLQFSD